MNTESIYSKAAERLSHGLSLAGIEALEAHLSSSARAYVFAGAVRDALISTLNNCDLTPKDFDFGIGGLTRAEFDQLGMHVRGVKNRYGGYKIGKVQGSCFELWRLEETIGVVLNKKKPTINNVLRSFILDVNSVGFDFKQRRILDSGCLLALRRRQIGLVTDTLFHNEENFAARAILLALRLSFSISGILQQFIRNFFDSNAFAYEVCKLPDSWILSWRSQTINKGNLLTMDSASLLQVIHEVSLSHAPSNLV